MNPIVGIGEVLWDIYPDGRKVAGGAPFNFAFHCHQLGHRAVIVSRVGNDDLGNSLRQRVRELGLSDEHIQTDRKQPTGTVQVSVDKAGQPTYTIGKNVAWDDIEWTKALAELNRNASVVCHGTLALRSRVSRQTILKCAGLKSARGKEPGLVVYDVNLREKCLVSEDAIRRAHWIKVNETEYPALEDCIDNAMDDDPWPRTQEGYFQYLRYLGAPENQVWLATRGAAGAEIVTEKSREAIRGVPAKVVDTVGAGDAFTAAMVCLHLEGRPLRECARFANYYAARVCEQPGGTPQIDRREVEIAAFGR
jgi:fructokinase